MSTTTPDQPVTPDESTVDVKAVKAAKAAKVAKAAKAPKRAKAVKKGKKKTGVPEIKFFITAAALSATIGGWAGFATSLAAQPSAPAPVGAQIAPAGQVLVSPSGQVLRSVSAPNASAANGQVLRQATRPEPVTRSRSSN